MTSNNLKGELISICQYIRQNIFFFIKKKKKSWNAKGKKKIKRIDIWIKNNESNEASLLGNNQTGCRKLYPVQRKSTWNMISYSIGVIFVSKNYLQTVTRTNIPLGKKRTDWWDSFAFQVKVDHPGDDVSDQWLNDLNNYLTTVIWICIKFYKHQFTFNMWLPWDIFNLID